MNKLTKLLSVFVIAGAIGTGVAGVAGCKKTPTPEECDHDTKLVWVDDNNGTTHHQECADHSDYKKNENTPHRYDNDQDTTCNDCGYVRTVTSEETPVESVVISGAATVERGKAITLTATVTPAEAEQSVTWSITAGSEYATIDSATGVLTGVAIGDVTVTATSTKDSTKTATHDVKVTVEAHDHQWNETYTFNAAKHWKTCKVDGCEEHSEEGAHVGLSADGTGTCTTCGAEIKHAVYELSPTAILQNEEEFKNTTYADGLKSGIFTILPTTTVRTRDRLNYNVYDYNNGEGTSADTPVETGFNAKASVQFNGEKRGFSVNAVAPGNLTFYCDNGSGGKTKTDKQSIMLTRPNGETETIYYYCGDIYAITINCDEVGEYKITRGKADGVGTTDVYYAKFEANVAVTPIKDIEIVTRVRPTMFSTKRSINQRFSFR